MIIIESKQAVHNVNSFIFLWLFLYYVTDTKKLELCLLVILPTIWAHRIIVPKIMVYLCRK